MRTFLLLWSWLLLAPLAFAQSGVAGRVVDAQTGLAIAGALVTGDGEVVATDQDGRFRLQTFPPTVAARAVGYRRSQPVPPREELDFALLPHTPKAIYLSGLGMASPLLSGRARDLLADTELNALVIDVKGDRGQLSYRSALEQPARVGAQGKVPLPELPALLAELQQRQVYAIARLVVFKDLPLATARPELAVRTASGAIWRDRENLAWVDPFRPEVWDYNLAIAEEVARMGFDEIQFDYVRFPDARGLRFSQPNTEAGRVAAISGFLQEARRRLAPSNVFIAADIFGYVCWNPGDTEIGQRLVDLAAAVDYLSPMLYPSGFQFGIPGYRNPVQHPGPIVLRSLQQARQRTGLSPLRFRPWLQAFRDYAFDGRSFAGAPLRAQIDAAESFGAHGWMLWNPGNNYSREGLKD